MRTQEIHDFTTMLDREGILLCYRGYLSEKVLAGLAEALKTHMATESTKLDRAKRVFSVFVEQAQNVMRYSSDRVSLQGRDELRYGLVSFGIDHDKFFILAGNRIDAAQMPELKKRLEELQTLDKEQLQKLYREVLRQPADEDSASAGLGLIEIARRSSEPFEFDFEKVDDTHLFFCIKAFV